MEKSIFNSSSNGKRGIRFSAPGVVEKSFDNMLPKNCLRKDSLNLPELTELDLMRYFINLSRRNFSVDTEFYPLGSCTMKYNPKINEQLALLDGFTCIHPEQPENTLQGALELMYKLQISLQEITAMQKVSLQPAAGAHGEFAGMLIVKKYFENKVEKRTKIIIPDSAHGTNPASAKMCGFDVIKVSSNAKGQVDLNKLKDQLDNDVAAIMMTNPNTLGIFEEEIHEISKIAKEKDVLLYYDGANLNAIMGITSPGLMGFDIVHVNLHKTFSTPHGGGGPGSGTLGVSEKLVNFLPVPLVNYKEEKYYLDYDYKNSIGKVKPFYGNFGVLIKAYAYILMMGRNGLKKVSQDAVLNANYLKEKLKNVYKLAFNRPCMHEFVLSGDIQKEQGINTMGIAKRLMDFNIHPPTVYFPMIISESMMIEPTETENKETLDNFIDVMLKIASEIKENPEQTAKSPLNSPVCKVDEVGAARKPVLKYQ